MYSTEHLTASIFLPTCDKVESVTICSARSFPCSPAFHSQFRQVIEVTCRQFCIGGVDARKRRYDFGRVFATIFR